MPFVSSTDEVSIYFEDHGEGTPFLLVHPGLMNHRVWEHQASYLLENHRVVTVDLRGHGRSDTPVDEYEHRQHATDVRAVIEHLELTDVLYVGWSLGSIVGVELLGQTEETFDAVVLSSTGIHEGIRNHAKGTEPPSDSSYPEHIAEFVERLRVSKPTAMMEMYVDEMLTDAADDQTKRWMWSICMQTPAFSCIEVLKAFIDTDYPNLTRILRNVQTPVTVFQGGHDVATDADAARFVCRRVIPNSDMVLFENSGHAPMIEEPERYNRSLSNLV